MVEENKGKFDEINEKYRNNSSNTKSNISYYRDWLKPSRNPLTVISFYFIIFVFSFAFFTPWIWPLSPYKEDHLQKSIGPSFNAFALVIPNHISHYPITIENNHKKVPAKNTSPQGLSLVGLPSTEYVHLTWLPVTGAEGYKIYRHEYAPNDRRDLGIPLETIQGSKNVSYLDTLTVKNKQYYYSLVSLFNEEESKQYSILAVKIQQAVTVDALIKANSITPDSRLQNIGKYISLQSHPFGTDANGRDLLSRLSTGTQTSLIISIVSSALCVLLILFFVLLGSYFDSKYKKPFIVLSILTQKSIIFLVIASLITSINSENDAILTYVILLCLLLLCQPKTIKLIREHTDKIIQSYYTQASKSLGANKKYLIINHTLPNISNILFLSVIAILPSAIYIESFLSFIGMGIKHPTISWGSLCNEAMNSISSSPFELLLPLSFIALSIIAFSSLSNHLHRILNKQHISNLAS